MANAADFILASGGSTWGGDQARPLGFVDLDSWPAGAAPGPAPPFPLIGLGDPGHPLAGGLDAVVEDPVSADALARSCARSPLAAAAAVQLLRAIDGIAPRHALPIESFCYAMLQGSAEHRTWLGGREAPTALPPGHVRLARDGASLDITIDRPAGRNAFDVAIRDGLFEAFTLAGLDADIRQVRLRSVGPAFSIGGDLAEFGTARDPAQAHAIRCRTLPALPLSACAEKVEVHIQGACIGAGIELAAFAGRVTAAPRAWFQLPELAMGLIPGAGGCVSIPRRIGRQRTALMILSGRRIDAATALGWGLIDAIVDQPPVNDGSADQV